MVLVVRVTGDCPSCGSKNCFGNIGVYGNHVQKACRHCRHRDQIWLPKLEKKVLYLDQSLLSSAFRKQDTNAVSLVERIKRIALDQLLVVPYSSVHEDETQMLQVSKPGVVENLMDFIKRTSGGHQFKPAYEIEHKQVHDAYRRFLEIGPVAHEVSQQAAIRDNINVWDDYIFIDVPGYFGDPAVNNANKQDALEQLLDLIEHWRTSNQSFDDAFRHELSSAGREFIHAYAQKLARICSDDIMAHLEAPIIARVVQGMLTGCNEDETARRIVNLPAFFDSQYFSECPYQWISARIFAVLRHQVQRDGAFSNRDKAANKLRGLTYDIRHTATYAPYCDAIFVDNAMAHILRDKRLNLTKRYGTQVFSMGNRAEFEAWLYGLENGMSEEHKAGLAVAYP